MTIEEPYVNWLEQMAVCDVNYRLLLRLMPQLAAYRLRPSLDAARVQEAARAWGRGGGLELDPRQPEKGLEGLVSVLRMAGAAGRSDSGKSGGTGEGLQVEMTILDAFKYTTIVGIVQRPADGGGDSGGGSGFDPVGITAIAADGSGDPGGGQGGRAAAPADGKPVTAGLPDCRQVMNPTMRVRLCHDVKAAEVLSYQGHMNFKPRYPQPNPKMYHVDEKFQVNRFLGEWLSHCLCIARSKPVAAAQVP